MTEPPDIVDGPNGTDDWMDYLEEVHQAFLDSFVHQRIEFKGHRVTSPRHPEYEGMGSGFWHLVTEAREPGNTNEDERVPDFNRCRRIRWIAWAIEGASIDDDGFLWWEEDRGRNKHVVIWLPEHEYAVVLARRTDRRLLREQERHIYSKKAKAPMYEYIRALDAPSTKVDETPIMYAFSFSISTVFAIILCCL